MHELRRRSSFLSGLSFIPGLDPVDSVFFTAEDSGEAVSCDRPAGRICLFEVRGLDYCIAERSNGVLLRILPKTLLELLGKSRFEIFLGLFDGTFLAAVAIASRANGRAIVVLGRDLQLGL